MCLTNDINDVSEYAWHKKNSDRKPHNIALKKPNHIGLYDMLGNVFEWCLDNYEVFINEAVVDPCIINNTNNFVIRGGACNSKYIACSPTRRNYTDANSPCSGIGFRIVLTQSEEYNQTKMCKSQALFYIVW